MGHLRHLRWCRSLGDELVVAVNSDDDIRRLKSREPIVDHETRMEMIRGCRYADCVVGFEGEQQLLELIRRYRPAVLAKGPPWVPEKVTGEAIIGSWGGRIVVNTNDWPHTGDILARIRR